MDGAEHRTYGCAMQNQRSKTECEEAPLVVGVYHKGRGMLRWEAELRVKSNGIFVSQCTKHVDM